MICESLILRVEHLHEADPREAAWTVAAYETPVSDRTWHLALTSAAPCPSVEALLTALASGEANDTDLSGITE